MTGSEPSSGSGDTLGAVVVAGVVNLAIAAAKLVAGLLTGSAAMLSEAAHSAADTVTEVLLFFAGRSAIRPADAAHPLGFGRVSFAWALLASGATFVLGAGFSITHGMHELADGEAPTDVWLNLTVLAVSGVLEAISLRRSRRETRSRAALWHISEADFVHATSDTPLRAVVLEDVVALLGVVIAAAGLALSAATGSATWDALSSVAVGLLLLVAAVVLAGRNVSLLVGRSAPRPIDAAIGRRISQLAGISRVAGLYTEATGPGRYLVLARVDFDDALSAVAVEAVAQTVETTIRADFPIVDAVYVHPTGVD